MEFNGLQELIKGLRRLLYDCGLSINAISDRSGVHRETIGKLYNYNDYTPKLETIESILGVFGYGIKFKVEKL